ncbi:MAG TPA: UDP-N-acetylmuramoyl-L-alanine--D-glutamate ligase [Candidatus Saccharimonadales bacterium]
MKIAVAGYGLEGEASYRYFTGQGHDVTIIDEREVIDNLPEGASAILGKDSFVHLKDYDMVIRTPSLAPVKLHGARKIWSATNEFFAQCPAPIIGVTGTKGKGTTSSLTAEILRASGRTVHLVGNIGTPAIDALPSINKDDIVVYELSSFQLWDLERSPHVAVVLMIEPDHLNVHEGMNDYVLAKANIGAHQMADDVMIYHPTNEQSARIAGISLAGHKLKYLTSEAAYINNGMITIDSEAICPADEVGLLGEYNLQNVCAAISAAWQFTQDTAAIADAVRTFKGLPHRLEFVRESNGVKYYNDSFSSAPTATMAAITAFEEPIVLIVGGFDRGIDFDPLVKAITGRSNIRQVIAMGQTGARLGGTLADKGMKNIVVSDAKTMPEIVALANKHAQPGDVVLLSPGCASFDMFKNFYERGEQFKQAVGEL